MKKKYESPTLFEFQEKFSDNDSCQNFLGACRTYQFKSLRISYSGILDFRLRILNSGRLKSGFLLLFNIYFFKFDRLLAAHIQLINATFRFEILSLLQNRKEGQFSLSLLCW